jgi:hypothetical protein
MTSSAVSASPPRSAPVGTTRRDSIVPADTARLVTRRFPPQYSAHPRPTAARATSRHPQQTDPGDPSADEGIGRDALTAGGVLGPGECASSAAGHADTPRNPRKPVEHAPTTTVEKGAWPVTHRHGHRSHRREPGHRPRGGCAALVEGGDSTMFGKTASSMQLCASGQLRVACCPPAVEGNTLGVPQGQWHT